jgi:hypothetical protein
MTEIQTNKIRMWLIADGIYANKKGFEPLVRCIEIYRRNHFIMPVYEAVAKEFGINSTRVLIKQLQGTTCTSHALRKMEKKSVGAYVAMVRTVLESEGE